MADRDAINVTTKSERLHDENTKRAYVAASRRTDRSVEARVTSAHRASEIHKKLTGKRLRISKHAVLSDEMYEEEDGSDGIKAPPSVLQLDQIWKETMINRLFDEYFFQTPQRSKIYPHTSEKFPKHHRKASMAPLPDSRRRLLNSSRGQELTFHDQESVTKRDPSTTSPWTSNPNAPLHQARKEPKALMPNAMSIDHPWPESAGDDSHRSGTAAADTDALPALTLHPSPGLNPGMAIDHLYTDNGQSNGIMNEGMGAADWINVSELQLVSLGET